MEVDCNGGLWEEVCFNCIKPRLCYWWMMNAGRDSDRKCREREINLCIVKGKTIKNVGGAEVLDV